MPPAFSLLIIARYSSFLMADASPASLRLFLLLAAQHYYYIGFLASISPAYRLDDSCELSLILLAGSWRADDTHKDAGDGGAVVIATIVPPPFRAQQRFRELIFRRRHC